MTLDPYAWCQRNGWDLPDTQWARTAVGVLWDAFGPLYRLNSDCIAMLPDGVDIDDWGDIVADAPTGARPVKIRDGFAEIQLPHWATVDGHGWDLSAVAEKNLAKLSGRQGRGTLQGAGDER